jgi:4a-hydroxytetrahydrobiopterin dehydratase
LPRRRAITPTFRFDWGYCTIELYTQKSNGLHEDDFVMAAKINTLPQE